MKLILFGHTKFEDDSVPLIHLENVFESAPGIKDVTFTSDLYMFIIYL